MAIAVLLQPSAPYQRQQSHLAPSFTRSGRGLQRHKCGWGTRGPWHALTTHRGDKSRPHTATDPRAQLRQPRVSECWIVHQRQQSRLTPS